MSAASCIFHVGNLIEHPLSLLVDFTGPVHSPSVWLIAQDRPSFWVFIPKRLEYNALV